MKAFLIAVIFGLLATLSSPALAQCGNDVTPQTKIALLQSAEGLTKCSAFYHLLSIGAFGTQNAEDFKRWSKASREAIITAAMTVSISGGGRDHDPTTKFDEHVQSLGDSLAAGGSELARGINEECKAVSARYKRAMMDYVEGK